MAGEGHLRLYLIKHDLLLFHSNCVYIFVLFSSVKTESQDFCGKIANFS